MDSFDEGQVEVGGGVARWKSSKVCGWYQEDAVTIWAVGFWRLEDMLA